MRMKVVAGTMIACALGLLFGAQGAAEDAPKHTIKQVMKAAHKDGLMAKVAAGEGNKEDAEKLVDLYTALGQNKPPKGEEGSWKEKTGTLLQAAKDVVEGKAGAGPKLKAAADCKNCHSAHKA